VIVEIDDPFRVEELFESGEMISSCLDIKEEGKGRRGRRRKRKKV